MPKYQQRLFARGDGAGVRRGDDLERLYERILVRSRRGSFFVFGLGGLGASDFLIECIDVGVLDHGVERLKTRFLSSADVHALRQVVKLLKRTLELGVASSSEVSMPSMLTSTCSNIEDSRLAEDTY